jgi:ammonium transporter, Amt family
MNSQLVGALFIIGWNIVWTTLILWFIQYALRIPLRMSDEMLLIGDDAIHGVSSCHVLTKFAHAPLLPR